MHEMGQLSSQRMAPATDLDPQRAAEWLLLRYPQLHPGPDSQPGKIPKSGAFLVADAVYLEARPLRGIRERRRPVFDMIT